MATDHYFNYPELYKFSLKLPATSISNKLFICLKSKRIKIKFPLRWTVINLDPNSLRLDLNSLKLAAEKRGRTKTVERFFILLHDFYIFSHFPATHRGPFCWWTEINVELSGNFSGYFVIFKYICFFRNSSPSLLLVNPSAVADFSALTSVLTSWLFLSRSVTSFTCKFTSCVPMFFLPQLKHPCSLLSKVLYPATCVSFALQHKHI